MCYKTDKSRDLIRSLPVRSAFGLPSMSRLRHAAPFSTLKPFGARNDKNARSNGDDELRLQEFGEDDNPHLHF
jgi:hypothetical protein